ncbi:MAG TPA: hypothetical protein VJB57_00495 [Dehalococcoidia bacterium]|nr:hypothetical protein [Dehalococcoidia bacterium]
MTRTTLWVVVLLFILAQNAQVAFYGVVFRRIGLEGSTLDRVMAAFKAPLFLASLVVLSIATAVLRLWLFPEVGVARTHVITSAAVVLSFAVFSFAFGEGQTTARYLGVVLCAVGILLLAR